MRPTPGSRRSIVAASTAVLVLAGCAASRAEPPGPGYQRGAPVGLAGSRVMILPVQMGGTGDLDREIGYALSGRGPNIEWIATEELRLSVARNPGIEVDALPVESFLAGDLIRIGDPLFGQLYRLGGLANATYAVIPIEATLTTEGGIALSAALVDVRTGLVPWFAVVAGQPGGQGSAYASATAAEAMARRLLP